MNAEITVALLSAAGTLIGSLGGILASNRLTNYRIAQLEKRVDKHNNLVERMAAVGGEVTPGTTQQFRELIHGERVRYEKLIREAKIKAE